MSSEKEKFKKALKNCKSLEDYRLLAEEYNIHDNTNADMRAYLIARNRRYDEDKIYPNRWVHLTHPEKEVLDNL
tara:strand:+ start:201 stop:422 length:222 start_codon:yes stop_codon:yes gene_type:complete